MPGPAAIPSCFRGCREPEMDPTACPNETAIHQPRAVPPSSPDCPKKPDFTDRDVPDSRKAKRPQKAEFAGERPALPSALPRQRPSTSLRAFGSPKPGVCRVLPLTFVPMAGQSPHLSTPSRHPGRLGPGTPLRGPFPGACLTQKPERSHRSLELSASRTPQRGRLPGLS